MRKALFFVCFIIFGVITTAVFRTTQQANMNYYPAQRLFMQGKYGQAAPYYEKSIKFGKNDFSVYKELGFCYLWTQEHRKAIAMLEKALQIKSNDYNIKFSLAQAYSWIKEYDKAISLMKEVSDNNKDINYKISLAEVHLWNSEPEKALSIAEKALKNDPNNKKAKMILGKALYFTGQSEKASKIFEELKGTDDE